MIQKISTHFSIFLITPTSEISNIPSSVSYRAPSAPKMPRGSFLISKTPRQPGAGTLYSASPRYPNAIFTFFCTRSEEHTSELQSRGHLVCRLLLEKKKHLQS